MSVMKSMKQKKAISFIRQRGTQLDLLRLRHTLGESIKTTEVKKILALYQFPDGNWDYKGPDEESNRIGSLGGTIHCLRWLREFNLQNNIQMARTLEFLSVIQSSDGSFYETDAKLAHSPQKWLQKNTLIDRFYFTAAVPMRLFSLGFHKHTTILPALDWLQLHWSDWDLVAATWYGPWALLCVLKFLRELNETLFQSCYDFSLKWLSRLDAQPLTWLLDSLHGAGFSSEDILVKEGITRLLSLQKDDGTWPDPQYSTVETTLTALRLLYDYEGLEEL